MTREYYVQTVPNAERQYVTFNLALQDWHLRVKAHRDNGWHLSRITRRRMAGDSRVLTAEFAIQNGRFERVHKVIMYSFGVLANQTKES